MTWLSRCSDNTQMDVEDDLTRRVGFVKKASRPRLGVVWLQARHSQGREMTAGLELATRPPCRQSGDLPAAMEYTGGHRRIVSSPCHWPMWTMSRAGWLPVVQEQVLSEVSRLFRRPTHSPSAWDLFCRHTTGGSVSLVAMHRGHRATARCVKCPDSDLFSHALKKGVN